MGASINTIILNLLAKEDRSPKFIKLMHIKSAKRKVKQQLTKKNYFSPADIINFATLIRAIKLRIKYKSEISSNCSNYIDDNKFTNIGSIEVHSTIDDKEFHIQYRGMITGLVGEKDPESSDIEVKASLMAKSNSPIPDVDMPDIDLRMSKSIPIIKKYEEDQSSDLIGLVLKESYKILFYTFTIIIEDIFACIEEELNDE